MFAIALPRTLPLRSLSLLVAPALAWGSLASAQDPEILDTLTTMYPFSAPGEMTCNEDGRVPGVPEENFGYAFGMDVDDNDPTEAFVYVALGMHGLVRVQCLPGSWMPPGSGGGVPPVVQPGPFFGDGTGYAANAVEYDLGHAEGVCHLGPLRQVGQALRVLRPGPRGPWSRLPVADARGQELPLLPHGEPPGRLRCQPR